MGNPAMPPIGGYDGPADSGTQQYWLDVAWRALQAEIPGIATRVDNGDIDSDTVADVVTAAARRALRNPGGVEQETLRIDDWSESAKFADTSDDIYFTRAELRRLHAGTGEPVQWSGSVKYC